MKKSEIKPALEALKKIKMPKIEDKALRNLIIEDHFVLLAEQKKFEEANNDDQTVRLAGFEDDQKAIKELQDKFNLAENDAERRDINRKILAYKDYFRAVDDLNKAINDRGKEEFGGLKKVDHEKFMEEIQKQDFDLGIIEALYPLFVLEAPKED